MIKKSVVYKVSEDLQQIAEDLPEVIDLKYEPSLTQWAEDLRKIANLLDEWKHGK